MPARNRRHARAYASTFRAKSTRSCSELARGHRAPLGLRLPPRSSFQQRQQSVATFAGVAKTRPVDGSRASQYPGGDRYLTWLTRATSTGERDVREVGERRGQRTKSRFLSADREDGGEAGKMIRNEDNPVGKQGRLGVTRLAVELGGRLQTNLPFEGSMHEDGNGRRSPGPPSGPVVAAKR